MFAEWHTASTDVFPAFLDALKESPPGVGAVVVERCPVRDRECPEFRRSALIERGPGIERGMRQAVRVIRNLERQAQRQRPTRAEDRLWEKLKDGAVGVEFQRQRAFPFGIADFFCPWPGVIVEVDGPIHSAKRRADRARDAKAYETEAIITLRYTNEEVLKDVDGVVSRLGAEVKRIEAEVRKRHLRALEDLEGEALAHHAGQPDDRREEGAGP